MNHRNTLNTRLLPLSILISSLVSGGAMAMTQEILTTESPPKAISEKQIFTSGMGTTVIGNGGSFIVGEVKEKSIFEKLNDYLTQNLITPEQHEKLKTNVEEKEQKLLDKSKAQTAFEDAQDKADEQKEAASLQDKLNTQLQEKLKAAEVAKNKAEDKKNQKIQEKDTAITTINLDPADKDIQAKIAQAIASANQDVKAKTDIQAEKEQTFILAEQDKNAHEQKIQELTQKITEVNGELDIAQKTEKPQLEAEVKKEEKSKEDTLADDKSPLAIAQKAHEQTEKDLASSDTAKKVAADENKKKYDEELKPFDEKIAKAQQELDNIELKINELTKKTTTIGDEKNTADGETKAKENRVSATKKAKEDAEQETVDAQNKADEVKLVVNAIAEAEAATAAAEKVEKKYNSLSSIASYTDKADTAAQQQKLDAENELQDKTDKLKAAEDVVVALNQAKPTIDLPVIDQTIAVGETQQVIANTQAIATQVAGGTQNVETGGEIIGSIISEDGTVNLALGALANSTVITKGSMENNSGTDKNTVVGAEGVLALKGASDTELAQSKGAVIAQGGKVTIAQYSLVSDMVSEGEIIATDGAMISKANIKGGNLTLRSKAIATDTVLNDGIFTVETGAGATGTTVNGGQFIVNDGATVQKTVLNNSQFDLKAKATAEHTIVNKGATFIVSGEGTAKDTKVKGGIFELKSKMQAMKLEVDDGLALIGSALEGVTLNGGTTIFDKAAEITGTIEANKGSFLSVHEGAKTESADLNLAGNMVFVAEDAPQVELHRNSRAAFNGINGKPAKFAFQKVKLDGGSIDMSQTNAQLTMQSLTGNGSFNLGSALYNHATAPLNVTGDANGDFDVQINDSGVAPANLNIVDVKGVNTARFALSNGPVNLGNYKHNLVSDGKGGFKLVADKTALTPGAAGILAVANTTPTIFNAELSSIQNRLDKQSASANESGVWLTYLNDNYDVKGTATNFKQKLNGMTLGGDKAMELGEAVFSIGAFASHSSSNIKSDYQSSGSVESNSLGAYAQYLANSGYYLNGVMKTNQFKQNLNVTAKGSNASGNANFSGLGLAVKAGKHITIDELYVSPFVAMSSFTSGKSQYQLSNGMEAQSQGARTTTGTIGMNTGYRFVLNSGAEIKPYAIFSVDHDLMAKNDVVINNEMFDNSLKGTRANAGVGVNVNLTSNLSVGSEVKVSKGKNIATPMTINMGVAYTF
ncbi:TPA: autotransporter outer membrane beta-barrel domain-containing protein [Yersinia enterocolitica]|uniref:autotransporter outer membrane beta-barrel domain-containing protein n=1 Tax=Yersinia enterocolitica TaxID=630 RepID=UPI002814373C|nr:autotransporter outer membrane beta-barrel domain-containing protein [Yersinia enterocolitica]EKN6094765.1 autotransporter outer membrane beta-barrel domain-containing protein [Yersinia enterocolitica]HDL6751278.1 autotransporter outer membrane beta-barrel domain-containing protein [Yersinia enterocolitica]HDL7877748.1 autotransporter outer membrane beta-barrel domain-containing protein [Yersinia enterocolitica]HDL7891133.1 autotransporter outer membrane beta-barrel domain-containing protein